MRALEARSREFMQEKTEKRKLELRIQVLIKSQESKLALENFD